MSCFCSRAPSVPEKGVDYLARRSQDSPRKIRMPASLSPAAALFESPIPYLKVKIQVSWTRFTRAFLFRPGRRADRATKADLAWTAGGLCCLRPRVLLLVLEAISLQRRRPRRRRVRRSMRHLRSQFHKHKPAQIRVLRHSPGRARPKRLKAVTARARSDRHRRLVRKKGQEFGRVRRGRMH